MTAIEEDIHYEFEMGCRNIQLINGRSESVDVSGTVNYDVDFFAEP